MASKMVALICTVFMYRVALGHEGSGEFTGHAHNLPSPAEFGAMGATGMYQAVLQSVGLDGNETNGTLIYVSASDTWFAEYYTYAPTDAPVEEGNGTTSSNGTTSDGDAATPAPTPLPAGATFAPTALPAGATFAPTNAAGSAGGTGTESAAFRTQVSVFSAACVAMVLALAK